MKSLKAFASIAVLAGLTACAGPYHDRYGGGGADFDVYYDGAYGPYAGGYWGDGGFFYFSDGHGGYRRDEERHFHRERFEHGSPYRSEHPKNH